MQYKKSRYARMVSTGSTTGRCCPEIIGSPAKDVLGRPIDGLRKVIDTIKGNVPFSWGSGSDDIADVSWTIPTITLNYRLIFRAQRTSLGRRYCDGYSYSAQGNSGRCKEPQHGI
jgi:hypothetical protein